MKLTDEALQVLLRVYLQTLAVQSNMARTYAPEVAMLASMGLITTKESLFVYGRTWRTTAEGIQMLSEEDML